MENYVFYAAKERDRLVEALRELSRQQGFSRVVIGISGGKDFPALRRPSAPGPWGKRTSTASSCRTGSRRTLPTVNVSARPWASGTAR